MDEWRGALVRSTSTLEENAVEKSIEIYKLSDINFHSIDLSCIPNNSYKINPQYLISRGELLQTFL